MLGKPWAGWSSITVNGEHIGSASYLDWVPGLVINECIRYLQDNSLGFNIEFDAEGWNFGIVAIGNYFYTYDDRRMGKMKEVGYGREFVVSLMAEAIDDLERDFEDWVDWDAYTEEDAKRNREELTLLISLAKDVLNADRYKVSK